MANTDNKCKDLDVRDYWKEKEYDVKVNSLEELYSLQAKTQNMYFAFFVDLQDVRSFATVQFQKFRSECLFLLCQLSNFWVTYQISKVDKLLDKNVTNICQS